MMKTKRLLPVVMIGVIVIPVGAIHWLRDNQSEQMETNSTTVKTDNYRSMSAIEVSYNDLNLNISNEARITNITSPTTSANEEQGGATKQALPKTRIRINDQVLILQQETFAESLNALADITFFAWPGSGFDRYGGSLDLVPPVNIEYDTYSVREILSNRRVLKLYEEIGQLSPADASMRLTEALRFRMKQYRKQYDQHWDLLVSVANNLKDGGHGSLMSYQMGDTENVRLPGARDAVLALCFLAGEHKLYELHDEIIEVASLALEHREKAYNFAKSVPTSAAIIQLALHSIYSRPILATALLETSMQSEDAVSRHPVSHFELTAWDAELTPFDHPVLYGESPDYSRGRFGVTILTEVDDGMFDDILETTR